MEDFKFKTKKQEKLFNEIISKNNLSFMQQKQIYLGILSKVDVSIYARPEYNFLQMYEIG